MSEIARNRWIDFIKNVFTWRRASPLGIANPSKGAKFHVTFTWEFSGPSSRAGSSTQAQYEGQFSFYECVYMEN